MGASSWLRDGKGDRRFFADPPPQICRPYGIHPHWASARRPARSSASPGWTPCSSCGPTPERHGEGGTPAALAEAAAWRPALLLLADAVQVVEVAHEELAARDRGRGAVVAAARQLVL